MAYTGLGPFVVWSMLGRRYKWWPNTDPTSFWCLVYAGLDAKRLSVFFNVREDILERGYKCYKLFGGEKDNPSVNQTSNKRIDKRTWLDGSAIK